MKKKKLTEGMRPAEKLALLSMTVAAAMVLSFVESMIPPLTAIPGVKIGLANIAVIFALYRLGAKEAVAVSLLRVFLVSLLFGSVVSMAYGIAGASVSLLLMILLKKLTPLSTVTVSVVGGVAHNIGQIAVACFILDTSKLLYYLPFLLLSGTVAGIAVGAASGFIVKRLGND